MDFFLNSDRFWLYLGPFYLGWNNVPHPSVNGDSGDETFGVAVGRIYLGHYADRQWSIGLLDDEGCLLG